MIENGSVEIRFPEAIAADQIAADAGGVPVEQQAIENGVRWELTEPIQGQELSTQTSFPQTVLAANAQFRSSSGTAPQPDTGVTDPDLAPIPAAGIGIGGVLLCAFVLVMLFIAFGAISASARRRSVGGYPQTPTYGPDPFDQPYGPRPRRWRRRRGYGGWGGGWGIPPIIITPPYGRHDERSYDNNPLDGNDDDRGGGGGSSWDDSGGGGSSWGNSGGSGSSWGGGGGGGSSWGGGGGSSGGGGGNSGGGSGGGGFG